jgi:hypothetical protein
MAALRERSGSLAAPVLVHLTANCCGPLASAVSSRLERRAGRRRGRLRVSAAFQPHVSRGA